DGIAGAIVSLPPVTSTGSDLLPPSSFAITSALLPSVNVGLTGTTNSPSSSTVPVPLMLPSLSVTTISEPASPVPVICVPSVLIPTSDGVAGAIVSLPPVTSTG